VANGFEWEKVLPAWFSALSATVEPAEYARRIDEILNRHYAKDARNARRGAESRNPGATPSPIQIVSCHSPRGHHQARVLVGRITAWVSRETSGE